MNIFFNIDPTGLDGLGATLNSLVQHSSNSEEITIHFLCSELSEKDKQNLHSLLKLIHFKGPILFHDFDAKKRFGHLSSLHGNWTVYGRLLIPELCTSDRALYLDSDMIVMMDLNNLSQLDLKDKPLAAVAATEAKWTLDWPFFKKNFNWPETKKYFNSGFVLFNLKTWREKNCSAWIEQTANRLADQLISHDQTLLNALCDGDFVMLPLQYNNEWFPAATKPNYTDQSIIHFAGSPKPWDVGGKWLHKGYALWTQFDTPFWKEHYNGFSGRKLIRTWNIKNSILRRLKDKLTSGK